MNEAVHSGILRAFSFGLLTSTSVLANGPAAADALCSWKGLSANHMAAGLPSTAARRRLGDRERPFDLGVHLNLTQGRPLSGELRR
jgi:predicted glycoside hydrolase/deacetylase ChbG (UPF0249 family)